MMSTNSPGSGGPINSAQSQAPKGKIQQQYSLLVHPTANPQKAPPVPGQTTYKIITATDGFHAPPTSASYTGQTVPGQQQQNQQTSSIRTMNASTLPQQQASQQAAADLQQKMQSQQLQTLTYGQQSRQNSGQPAGLYPRNNGSNPSSNRNPRPTMLPTQMFTAAPHLQNQHLMMTHFPTLPAAAYNNPPRQTQNQLFQQHNQVPFNQTSHMQPPGFSHYQQYLAFNPSPYPLPRPSAAAPISVAQPTPPLAPTSTGQPGLSLAPPQGVLQPAGITIAAPGPPAGGAPTVPQVNRRQYALQIINPETGMDVVDEYLKGTNSRTQSPATSTAAGGTTGGGGGGVTIDHPPPPPITMEAPPPDYGAVIDMRLAPHADLDTAAMTTPVVSAISDGPAVDITPKQTANKKKAKLAESEKARQEMEVSKSTPVATTTTTVSTTSVSTAAATIASSTESVTPASDSISSDNSGSSPITTSSISTSEDQACTDENLSNNNGKDITVEDTSVVVAAVPATAAPAAATPEIDNSKLIISTTTTTPQSAKTTDVVECLANNNDTITTTATTTTTTEVTDAVVTNNNDVVADETVAAVAADKNDNNNVDVTDDAGVVLVSKEVVEKLAEAVKEELKVQEEESQEQQEKEKEKVNTLLIEYKEGQWSPLNPAGKKFYTPEQLRKLAEDPRTKIKPDVKFEQILKKSRGDGGQNYGNIMGGMVERKQIGGRGVESTLMPHFAQNMGMMRNPGSNQSSGGGSYKRMSQQGNKASQSGGSSSGKMPLMPKDGGPIVKMSLSLNEEVKLNETENAWRPSHFKIVETKSEEEKQTEELYKRFRAILNKLTPEKFQVLVGQVKTLKIDTQERLNGCIELVFEKAISEPNFSVAYAQLCKQMSMISVQTEKKAEGAAGENGEKEKPPTSDQFMFRKILLNRCQAEFTTISAQNDAQKVRVDRLDEFKDDPEKLEEYKLTLEEEERKVRHRSMGTVRFIGELFKSEMLTSNIMNNCIAILMNNRHEDSLECLCKLLTTIGARLEQAMLVVYFFKLQWIVDNPKTYKISSRVRFMIQDLIDLKRNRWIPRPAVKKPNDGWIILRDRKKVNIKATNTDQHTSLEAKEELQQLTETQLHLRFWQRHQQPLEDVQSFMEALQDLLAVCEFESRYDRNRTLRNQFLYGLKDSHIREILAKEANLTWQTALKMAQAMEKYAEEAAVAKKRPRFDCLIN